MTNIPASPSNMLSLFLPQTYRSPLEVRQDEDSSEQEILVTGKEVNLLILCGMVVKLPMIPNPSWPLSFRPNEYSSLFRVLTIV